MTIDFPDNPFWNYSLRLYARPGVQEASLQLQDDQGLDVNLILFCIWCGLDGPGELTADEINEAMARAGRWQTEVVGRIRTIRRALKLDPIGADPELAALFRPAVQALELDGEHVEQLTLARMVPPERGPRGRNSAEANLQSYLERCGVCDGSIAESLALAILDAAAPGSRGQ